MNWIDDFLALNPCDEAEAWVVGSSFGPQELWASCDRPDWMVWLLVMAPKGEEEHRDLGAFLERLVLAQVNRMQAAPICGPQFRKLADNYKDLGFVANLRRSESRFYMYPGDSDEYGERLILRNACRCFEDADIVSDSVIDLYGTLYDYGIVDNDVLTSELRLAYPSVPRLK